MVDRNARFANRPIVLNRTVFYGHLEYILECMLEPHARLPLQEPTLFLLALVSRCITNGHDAALECVSYEKVESSTQFIDLMSIQAVVGRFRVATDRHRGPTRWGIIDRSVILLAQYSPTMLLCGKNSMYDYCFNLHVEYTLLSNIMCCPMIPAPRLIADFFLMTVSRGRIS
jgi:hypothetical protein